MSNKFCPACGKKHTLADIFCSSCGTPLDGFSHKAKQKVTASDDDFEKGVEVTGGVKLKRTDKKNILMDGVVFEETAKKIKAGDILPNRKDLEVRAFEKDPANRTRPGDLVGLTKQEVLKRFRESSKGPKTATDIDDI